jgi:HPt (histidine-containing phosphotransfer) domain-containing protein
MIHVERVCHAMEEALTLGRVDALFQAKDWLSGSFALYAGKKTKVERSSKLIALLTDKPESGHEIPLSWTPVAGAVQGEVSGSVVIKPLSDESWKDIPESLSEIEVMPGTDPSLLSDFLNESSEHLESIDVSLMTLESDPSNMDCLNAVFRAFHTIKGLTGFLNLHPIRVLAHESENLLDQLRSGERTLDGPCTEVLFASVDAMRKLIGLLDPSAQSIAPVALRDLIVSVRAVASNKTRPTKVGESVPTPAVAPASAQAPTPKSENTHSVTAP